MFYVSTIVSGVASLGVLIALLSGMFFLVLSGLRWVSRVRDSLYEEELRRQTSFLIGNSYLIGTRSSTFPGSKKNDDDMGTILFGTGTQENMKNSSPSERDNIVDESDLQSEAKPGVKENIISGDTIQVREFIEKLVETIIGGSLDGITVGKLSTHSAYLGMFTKYHSLLCRELARLGFALHLSFVHKNSFDRVYSNTLDGSLRRLIKRIVSEAMALPNIKEILCRPKADKEKVDEDVNSKSYEDILATAILNKVIESIQKEKRKEGVRGNERKKPKPRTEKVRRSDDDEEFMSNSDWSDTSRSDQLSLTIEEHIEEVTTAFEVSDDERSDYSDYEETLSRPVPFPESGRVVRDGIEDDNCDSDDHSSATELITSTNSWEENWLFQKKRLRSTPNVHHPVPVPMLVPNPSEDFRALVGGIDADDLSDMSDCSDSILDIITADVGLTMNPVKENDKETEHHGTGLKGKEEESLGKVDEAEEEVLEDVCHKTVLEEKERKKDRETEERDVEPESVTKEDKPASPNSTSPEILSQKDREFSVEDFNWLHHRDPETSQEGSISARSSNENEENLRCRVAEREKEKWKNAVELTDNPYSPENIEKREQQRKKEYFRIGTYSGDFIDFPDGLSLDAFSSEKPECLRFNRDYYINAAKHPSGRSSSSSINRLSEGNEKEESETEKTMELSVCDIPIKKGEKPKREIVRKYKVSLPNVKELARQFAGEEWKDDSRNTPEGKEKGKWSSDRREPELDYSSVPVSEIIMSLKNSSACQKEKQSSEVMYKMDAGTQIEIWRLEEDVQSEKAWKKGEGLNGKQVHSLTARSISKEFREGIKNNSYQRGTSRVEKGSSGVDNDQGEVVSGKGNSSPTPLVDLQNMKMFWEGIINANSSKPK